MAFSLAVCWTASGVHCQLENLAGFEFLRCSGQADAANQDGSHCADDGCVTLESGHYLTRCSRHSPPTPQPVAAVFPLRLLIRTPPVGEPMGGLVPTDAPPPDGPWHLRLRAALPPRAPSLVS